MMVKRILVGLALSAVLLLTLSGCDLLALFGITVTTNQKPIADPGSDFTVIQGDTATFDGSASYDPDGTIQSYSWDFGDGTAPGTGPSPIHTYSTAGDFTVTLTVTDDSGASSLPVSITVTVRSLVDSYEPDDSASQANAIAIGSSNAQQHSLTSGDADWVYFTGTAGHQYTIATSTVDGSLVDTYMYLYQADASTLIAEDDDGAGVTYGFSVISFTAPYTGTYFVQVEGFDSTVTGDYYVEVDDTGIGTGIDVTVQ